MTRYIVRRLLLMIPSVWIVATVTFVLLRIAPGDVVLVVFGDGGAKPGQIEAFRRELGLDQPLYVQYFRWLGQLVRLDFGTSVLQGRRVIDLIKDRLPNSLRLGVMAVTINWSIAIPIGVLAAVKQDSALDYSLRSMAVILDSIPNFFLAILVLVVPAFTLGWAPPLSSPPFEIDPWTHLLFLITPAIMIGINSTATLIRMTRSMLLEVLRADYIRTARAKGLADRRVILVHALKNALIPVVTILGGQVSLLLAGSVIMENIFGIPGMGQMALQAINAKDVSIVQTLNMLFATFLMVSHLLVDISYAWLDPRIRYS